MPNTKRWVHLVSVRLGEGGLYWCWMETLDLFSSIKKQIKKNSTVGATEGQSIFIILAFLFVKV